MYYTLPRRCIQLPPPPPPQPPSQPLSRANRHRDGAVRVIILVAGDILLEPRAKSRSPASPPPRTDEKDGDDAEDNEAEVLLACWYFECS